MGNAISLTVSPANEIGVCTRVSDTSDADGVPHSVDPRFCVEFQQLCWLVFFSELCDK